MSVVIQVDRLSKQYRLGQIGGKRLVDDVNRWWARFRGKEDPLSKVGQPKTENRKQKTEIKSDEGHDKFQLSSAREVALPISQAAFPISDLRDDTLWALKDVSFEVKQGEVLGIIGRNGAGKSTLLKILSRVTGPTAGEVRVKGRIASLLEVGTGFHPELTGHENIFLNGAILGMTKAEIRSKLDEIVDFSGVEQFIDTPVKRYSSGMTVRLAFAVAAHLEPEILIVDEVLAVGDAEFQKKCLGKMGDVAKGGRTVLLVSHNMAAISNLCVRAILLEGGRIVSCGEVGHIVEKYVSNMNVENSSDLRDRTDRSGEGRVRFTKLWIEDSNGRRTGEVLSGKAATIAAAYESTDTETLRNVRVSFLVKDSAVQPLVLFSTELTTTIAHCCPACGEIRCVVPRVPLTGSDYQISAFLEVNGVTQDYVQNAGTLSVCDGDFYGTSKLYPPGWRGKGVLVDHHWVWPDPSCSMESSPEA